MTDHRSYTHNLNSCEIKAFKKFTPEQDCVSLNCSGWHLSQIVGSCLLQ